MMRKCALTVTVVSVLLALASCEDDSRTKMLSDYHSDFDINYGLFHVYQYDEVNINGIDLASKFDFFNTFRLTLHYTDNEISAVTFDNGDVPFSPYSYEIPSGKVDAYLNTNVLPNELRLTDSEKVIAYYVNGEFSIPFKLDCPSLDYKYTFKSIQQ
ncbi:MAG TPA: hypothetical protein DEP71_11140 [Porphyromonadaceae bacterium]|jgi:hypothetical protein|uniref:hypothetical protein n=1 Tax=Proteiniphilum sp. UBA5463 TaxID=1947281 RepID=UPI000EE768CF|nr:MULTISPECIES: hypothetical protein [unclassified Proteiniphilum]HCB89821.1 hypothetical protein [Porphyromonadaceae bacterium]